MQFSHSPSTDPGDQPTPEESERHAASYGDLFQEPDLPPTTQESDVDDRRPVQRGRAPGNRPSGNRRRTT